MKKNLKSSLNLRKQELTGVYFKYIHIWASKDEIRVQCTDPQTIRVLLRSVRKEYPHVIHETRKDLMDAEYKVRMSNLEPGDLHQEIAWWLFKMMCAEGWEPMQTGDHWYKMKTAVR